MDVCLMPRECFMCACAYKFYLSACQFISCQVHFIWNELSWSTIPHLKWLLNHYRFERISHWKYRTNQKSMVQKSRSVRNRIWKWQRTIRLILFHFLWLCVSVFKRRLCSMVMANKIQPKNKSRFIRYWKRTTQSMEEN